MHNIFYIEVVMVIIAQIAAIHIHSAVSPDQRN